jgi:hypothetical protein
LLNWCSDPSWRHHVVPSSYLFFVKSASLFMKNVGAHFEHGVQRNANTFIKRPAGTMILHCQRHIATTCSPPLEGTSLDFWVNYSLILERIEQHSVDHNRSNESQR